MQGLRQSPIDLVPADLLYDPSLEELFITPNKVQGKVFNTGHTATYKVLEYFLSSLINNIYPRLILVITILSILLEDLYLTTIRYTQTLKKGTKNKLGLSCAKIR